MSYQPGRIAQCDLWFPAPAIPVAAGQDRVLPVLVMVLGFSRFITATMIPTRQAGGTVMIHRRRVALRAES